MQLPFLVNETNLNIIVVNANALLRNNEIRLRVLQKQQHIYRLFEKHKHKAGF